MTLVVPSMQKDTALAPVPLAVDTLGLYEQD